MRVRLTQIDGALPNLALMKLASWHKARGDEVVLTRSVDRDMFEGSFDTVYGSVLFDFSKDRLERFKSAWPGAVIGGTGAGNWGTVEQLIGQTWESYDYSGYPDFAESIGFTQRGCRLKCKFCVVPRKEGKNVSAGTIYDVWRGDPHPKRLHLLDNDFFGNPDWRLRLAEIKDGGFRVCLSQGINVRLINDEAAAALATIEYRDTKFKRRRLYTAWDNLGDMKVFFKGVDTLERAGIPPKHLMAYMLIGYAKGETFAEIYRRFDLMVQRGISPYPMVYDRSRRDLCAFQRWAVMGTYRFIPWNDYRDGRKAPSQVVDARAS